MVEHALNLRVVDGLALAEPLRQTLRPGELVRDGDGRLRRLPRWFYEVPTRQRAEETELAPGFKLWEFLVTDLHEATPLRRYPRYIPCAVTLLAAHLAVFRQRVDTYVHIAANGGYRSPGHALCRAASTHCWGTAVNIYRVGDDFLEDRETIERYAEIVRQALPGVWVRAHGYGPGFADDHLHFDLGYAVVTPHGVEGEREDAETKSENDLSLDVES